MRKSALKQPDKDKLAAPQVVKREGKMLRDESNLQLRDQEIDDAIAVLN